ncbi:MAG: serine/threonine protein kinase [Thiobacillaceae bacterium]|jgi:serine/threonine protein kinase|nr:serine/threonine protein kinase [Hydrogenophilales bacterium]MBP8901848.1 serine/threonine protein kinase [Thiobacillaceae bacterium]MBP9915390.1 serine/threonine protein kinase [Thiobacillaceae bacterium]
MAAQLTDPLAHGYHLADYVIDRRIGGGGFSLVYLAFDMEGQPVAIKEYLPGGIVKRGELGTVVPISSEKEASFRYGMKCFFDEGRALAGIRHPNVVKVVNFFRANDTVYMVMKYEQGKTLQRHITGLEEPMRETFLRSVFIQLLNGLREIHAHKILHLDIKPSNIYIRADGSPVLIDFGAARQALSEDMLTTSPMYTPGFAAPEQYSQRDRLGPWTDIYSVGATMYACIAKVAPPPANERVEKDKLTPVSRSHAGLYSKGLLELIEAMLKLNYTERPQSVFTVQKRLIAMAQAARSQKPTLFALIKERLTREL